MGAFLIYAGDDLVLGLWKLSSRLVKICYMRLLRDTSTSINFVMFWVMDCGMLGTLFFIYISKDSPGPSEVGGQQKRLVLLVLLARNELPPRFPWLPWNVPGKGRACVNCL